MKHLDLFSGYGGFTISANKYGIETIGFSEVDKYACSVLNYHYPNIKNYGDITKIKGEDLPTVDIITGGSPCQDLSVAGKGAGLNGERSGLFFHFIRLIKEKQPQYFVWENVKGALSSSKGWDFATVQIEMEQAGYDVFWQVINAKDFGVPQNRERIFAIGVRKGSGREILFEQRESRQNIKKYGDLDSETWRKRNESIRRVYSPEGIAPTTPTAQGGGVMTKIVEEGAKTGLYAIANGGSQSGRVYSSEGVSATISAGENGGGKRPGGFYAIPNSNGNIHSLDANYWKGSNNPNKSRRSQIITARKRRTEFDTSDIATTITSHYRGAPDGDGRPALLGGMRIRRLTPTECERLMSIPDGWTAKGIMDGKEVEISDTQRYKLCGNGVVVNCVDYIYSLVKL